RIRGTRYRAAGRAPFAEELRLIARRPAIGCDQNFVVLALHRASRNAVRTNDPDARARRTRWTFFALWTWGSRRLGRACRTYIAFGTLGSGRTLLALRALTTGG